MSEMYVEKHHLISVSNLKPQSMTLVMIKKACFAEIALNECWQPYIFCQKKIKPHDVSEKSKCSWFSGRPIQVTVIQVSMSVMLTASITSQNV